MNVLKVHFFDLFNKNSSGILPIILSFFKKCLNTMAFLFGIIAILLYTLVSLDQCRGQCLPVRHCGGVDFSLADEPLPKDCQDVYAKGQTTSGVYTIFPTDIGYCSPLRVYCNMEDGGGWTVFQRRHDGLEDFYSGWSVYRIGFGNLGSEFWLGCDHLHRLTNQDNYELKIILEDAEGEVRTAVYSGFKVGDERYYYPLTLGEMISGDAGDSLSAHSGQQFSTRDRDATSCASSMQGAWWYLYCGESNLNGRHPQDGDYENQYNRGIVWGAWHGTSYSLRRTEMMIRPASGETRRLLVSVEELTTAKTVTDAMEGDTGSGGYPPEVAEKPKEKRRRRDARHSIKASKKRSWYSV